MTSACARSPPIAAICSASTRAISSSPPAPPVRAKSSIPETITVAELANRMARRAVDVIKVLMKNGMMATPNDVIDADTAELVAAEYGHVVKRVAESDVLEGLTGADRRRRRRWCRVRRSSPSWAMSITARPRCSTRCARPMSCPAKPAASPSISAPIRCS